MFQALVLNLSPEELSEGVASEDYRFDCLVGIGGIWMFLSGDGTSASPFSGPPDLVLPE